MLTLSRREGESLYIYPAAKTDMTMTLGELFADGAIIISINKIKGSQVSIGLDAPSEL